MLLGLRVLGSLWFGITLSLLLDLLSLDFVPKGLPVEDFADELHSVLSVFVQEVVDLHFDEAHAVVLSLISLDFLTQNCNQLVALNVLGFDFAELLVQSFNLYLVFFCLAL